MKNMIDLNSGLYKPHEARILIALGLNGDAIILATDSEWVSDDVSMVGNSIDDIGISIPSKYKNGEPALLVWEGELTVEGYGHEDGGGEIVNYEGDCRSVHGLELSQLLDMKPPEN